MDRAGRRINNDIPYSGGCQRNRFKDIPAIQVMIIHLLNTIFAWHDKFSSFYYHYTAPMELLFFKSDFLTEDAQLLSLHKLIL